MATEADRVRLTAMNLLARREHSQLELHRKLQQRGFPSTLIEDVIIRLQKENLQSDDRFAEDYTQMRAKRGYGPIRIANELEQRGINAELAWKYIAEISDWSLRARWVREKKFGESLPQNHQERAKQQNFLQYRGFDGDAIKAALKPDPEYL